MVSSGILRSIYWWFITDVSAQPTLDCLTLEEGTDRLSRNVGDELAMYVGLNSRKAMTSYEGWNFNSGNYLFTTDTK